MKNKDIIALMDYGFSTITTHCLVASAAYSVYKLKKAVINTAMSISMMEDGFLKDSGIDKIGIFNQRLLELRQAGKSDELRAEEEKLNRYNELRKAMMEDEAEIEKVKLITYDDWRTLQEENKNKQINGVEQDILSGEAEMILENVLWAPPQEE